MSTPTLPSNLSEQLLILYRQALANGLGIDEVDAKVKLYAKRFLASIVVEEKEKKDRPAKIRRRLPW